MPFSGLTTFGTAFLSKFECSQMRHPVRFNFVACESLKGMYSGNWYQPFTLKLLDHITFVDTPGVLSGEKQRTQRSYDFTGVTSWFAAKCDLILLLFDPHKLDISDEFKRVIGSLRGHDDKIRVVLNKADQVDTQQVIFHGCFTSYSWCCILLCFAKYWSFFFLLACSLWEFMVHWCGLSGKYWIHLRFHVFILGNFWYLDLLCLSFWYFIIDYIIFPNRRFTITTRV